jgi:hypothetical protein
MMRNNHIASELRGLVVYYRNKTRTVAITLPNIETINLKKSPAGDPFAASRYKIFNPSLGRSRQVMAK